MKKTLLLSLLGLTLLIGCTPPQPPPIMSPPSWIHGTWSDEFGVVSYTFTATTMLQVAGSLTIDMAEVCRELDVSSDETITATFYSFTVPYVDSGYKMEFTKIDANTIHHTSRMTGISIGPTPLYRQ